MRSPLTFVLFTATLTALVPACKKQNSDPPSSIAPTAGTRAAAAAPAPAPPATPDPGPSAATAAPALSDPQIAAIVVAANQVDIDAGRLALEKSKNAEVKKFAQRMVTDHTAVTKAAVELVTKLKVTPVETDASRGLVTGGTDARTKLAALEGAAFDRAYVDNEIAYHKAVIGVLDSALRAR